MEEYSSQMTGAAKACRGTSLNQLAVHSSLLGLIVGALVCFFFNTSQHNASGQGVNSQPVFVSAHQAHERLRLDVSKECMTQLRQRITHQRSGWGDMSPSALYEGAEKTFVTGLKDFLPEEQPKRVLDIGCGMALYNFFLFKHYNFASSMQLYLFDKTTGHIDNPESFVGGGWHPDGKFSFYTSLECAAEILRKNTGLRKNIHEVNATVLNLQRLKEHSFDVIYSLLSYGHHYPVSTYLEEVFRLLRVGGVLILDLRVQGTRSQVIEGLTDLKQQGFICTIVRHRRRGKTVRCLKE